MKRQLAIWKRAERLNDSRKQEMAMLTALRMMLDLFLLMLGCIAQNALRAHLTPASLLQTHLNLWDFFALASITGGCLISAPLRTFSAWRMAEISGLLDECDRGFLKCSSKIWLWTRWGIVQLLLMLLILISLIPAAACFRMANAIFLTAVQCTDSTFILLFTAHLWLFGMLSLYLPLRISAAATALPLCYLKSPHYRLYLLILQSFAVTRGDTAVILLRRLLCLPMALLPMTALRILPTLRIAELLTVRRRLTHLLQNKQSVQPFR